MQNDQPEILIRSDVGFSFNLYQVLFWDGEGFAAVMWETHYDDEPRSAMVATDFEARDLGADGIPEVQLIFGPDGSERAYAYVDVYQIRDEGFHFTCQIYKGEEPTFADPDALYAIEAVEEADSAFRCGYDNIAEVLLRQVVEDDSLAIFEFDAAPSFFERENLRAFSLYRLVLLNARRGDVDAAASAYEELQAEFPVEVPGSNYTSMAEAFWLEYEQSADWDAACHALADYLEPTVTAILEDETRFARALYLSPIAGYPGHRPNALIRACPDDDLNLGLPDPAIPGMR
jgi:hypothetical protein